jgi:uncharacterized membrane protein
VNIQRYAVSANDPISPYSTGRSNPHVNVNQQERTPSAVLGAVLLLIGLGRRSLGGAVVALAGGELLYRGLSGHCHLYEALGINTAQPGANQEAGPSTETSKVERSITIDKPADELYALWREPSTLSRIMGDFAEVTQVSQNRQHWTMRMPRGRSLEWDSQILEDRPGEFLRWQSVEGAQLTNEGSIHFGPAPGNRGTEMTLRMRFDPPGGAVGKWAIRLLGFAPRVLATKALYRFKSLAETGEIPTLKRNPAARDDGRDYA